MTSPTDSDHAAAQPDGATMRSPTPPGSAASGTRSHSSLIGLITSTRELKAWWTKVNRDWVFNLAGLLAYNLLMSTFPILIVLVAAAGVVLGSLAPQQLDALRIQIAQALPGANQVNFVSIVTSQLRDSAGILLAVGLVTAAFAGSRLFIVIENCFDVIFRLPSRKFLAQNLMAFGMLCLYVVLIPLIALGTIVPQAINGLPGVHSGGPFVAAMVNALGVVIAVVVAFVLFGVIYLIVPNRRVRLGEVWQGTLVAAFLMVLYTILFPVYEALALHPNNYGSVAGFAIVILVFFYYLAFILLIGAEVNAWVAGQRQATTDIASTLHAVAAGGTPQVAAERSAK